MLGKERNKNRMERPQSRDVQEDRHPTPPWRKGGRDVINQGQRIPVPSGWTQKVKQPGNDRKRTRMTQDMSLTQQ